MYESTVHDDNDNSTTDRFRVVEHWLHYRTNDGRDLRFNLDIPSGVLIDVLNTKGDDAEASQFVSMLNAMGDEQTLQAWRGLGFVTEGLPIVTRYFVEFERLAGAQMGELQRSSRS